jgi:predicted RNA-binding protein YlxR (DUF448 family)
VRLAVSREEGVRPRRAVIDPAGTLPGRGAYLCRRADAAVAAPNPDCLSLAVSRRGIARALRCAVSVDAKLVESINR